MRKLFAVLALCGSLCFTAMPVLLLSGSGCTMTQQKVVLTSLVTAHHAADTAYKLYIADAFLKERAGDFSATNGVPAVTREYEAFQATYNLALLALKGNVKAPAPVEVLGAKTNLLTAISVAQ